MYPRKTFSPPQKPEHNNEPQQDYATHFLQSQMGISHEPILKETIIRPPRTENSTDSKTPTYSNIIAETQEPHPNSTIEIETETNPNAVSNLIHTDILTTCNHSNFSTIPPNISEDIQNIQGSWFVLDIQQKKPPN